MDIITVVSLVAASITILTGVYVIYKRVRRLLVALDSRLNAVEDSFKVREELFTVRDIVVENIPNKRLYTLPKGTRVVVYEIVNGTVEFVTEDKLISAKIGIEHFIQGGNE